MKQNKINKKFVYLISPDKIKDENFYINLAFILSSRKVSFFQLRLKKETNINKLIIGKKIKKICKKYKVKFLINDDPLLAKKLDADGCHLGQKDMDLIKARKILKNKIIGITCHNSINLAKNAIAAGADYLAFGAFYVSKTKVVKYRANLAILKSVKKIKFLDIILLSFFYIIRIYFGGELVEIEISNWLYSFCIVAFMSLVILKRVNEIKKYKFKTSLYLEKNFKDLKFILIVNNYLSLSFLFFYLLSDKVTEIYNYPKLLWILLPLYFYWTKNINNFALSGKMNDDPVKFVLTNRKSLLTITLMGSIILIAQLVDFRKM